MASLKKNFSIAKLYSDLEKYQSNLNGFKDSRLKKQTSGASLHQRPNSSHHKNYQSRESLCYPNLTRFQKTKLEVGTRNKNPRQTYQNFNYEHKNSFVLDRPDYEGITVSHNSSVLRENYRENYQDNFRQNSRQIYKEKQNKSPKIQFNKSDEMYFLSQCNKLYKLNEKDSTKNFTAEQEADSVKTLLNEINKRDKVYQAVSKKFGTQNIEQKLTNFFENYDRLKKIISQFKKMSKLNIDDDKQLYDFLITDEEEKQKENFAREEEELTQKRE